MLKRLRSEMESSNPESTNSFAYPFISSKRCAYAQRRARNVRSSFPLETVKFEFIKKTKMEGQRIDSLLRAYNYCMKNKNWTEAQRIASLMTVEADFSIESAFYLMDAYYMDGKLDRAIDAFSTFMNSDGQVIQRPGDVRSEEEHLPSDAVFLYALCCYGKERYADVVSALYPHGSNMTARLNSAFKIERIDLVVNGAAGLELLGKALERLGDREGALECFSKCVDLNPMMLGAFDKLSVLSLELSKSVTPPVRFSKTHLSDEAFARFLESPTSISSANGSVVGNAANPPAIMTSTPIKQRAPSNTGRRALSPPSVSKPPLHPRSSMNGGGSGSINHLIQTFAAAMHALNAFDANVVIDIVSRLPTAYQECSIVQAMVGRALLEAGRFSEAETAFEKALKFDPFGVGDYADLYSSALWQLRKEKELAQICTHGLRTVNRATCAKIWIAVGNSFSLQKESDVAIKFLNRAVQVDPHYAYAHVLIGHEFASQDKFEKAKQCYLRALQLDPRNFSAFWGLGQIHARQEELANAKYFFTKALEINPKSSTVRFALATAAMGLRENELAYQQLSLAFELNPRNVPALCQKGMLEMTVFRKLDAAKETLEKALALQASEPVIYVLLGKIYASEGAREKAMKCYNEALEILRGAKDNYGIKQCIEELDFFANSADTVAN
jgi:tetratricopeptide (TPR) repeat protein